MDYGSLSELLYSWDLMRNSLVECFPHASVYGRFRGDIYGGNTVQATRDSAGLRLVVNNSSLLDDALALIDSSFSVAETRNYLNGHPRHDYYRAYHYYLRYASHLIELQVRTARQDRISVWAHRELLVDAERISSEDKIVLTRYLSMLSHHYDGLDRNQNDTGLPDICSVPQSFAASIAQEILHCDH